MIVLVAALSMPAQQKKNASTNRSATRQTTAQKKTQNTTKRTQTTTKRTQPATKRTQPATKRSGSNTSKSASRNTTTKRKGTTQKKPSEKEQLQQEKQQVHKSVEANKKKQAELVRNVKKGMENLMVIDHEIMQKKRVIDTIRQDITTLDGHIILLDRQLNVLENELTDRKNRYRQSLRYMHRNRTVQNQLMFVFSADNFNQMYRRMRFMRQYAAFQKAQGEAIKTKQDQVSQKQNELKDSKHQKGQLLARDEAEHRKLEGKQTEQKAQVEQLKKQERTVNALIIEQQKKEAELNDRIEKIIAEEIAREQARREAEAKRRAEEARKKAEAEAARKRAEEQKRAEEERRRLAESNTNNSNTSAANKNHTAASGNSSSAAGNKSTASADKSSVSTSRNTTTTPTVSTTVATSRDRDEDYSMPAADRELNSNFAANKGKLPLPISGSYKLVRGFGPYSPEGLRHVTLVSNGWHLKGKPGAKAQSIFNGVVSGVYLIGDNYVVTVRHGNYISVYTNLSSVSVKKNQKVSTCQALGRLGSDNTMQFQLRNSHTLLNPSGWLRR